MNKLITFLYSICGLLLLGTVFHSVFFLSMTEPFSAWHITLMLLGFNLGILALYLDYNYSPGGI